MKKKNKHISPGTYKAKLGKVKNNNGYITLTFKILKRIK